MIGAGLAAAKSKSSIELSVLIGQAGSLSFSLQSGATGIRAFAHILRAKLYTGARADPQ